MSLLPKRPHLHNELIHLEAILTAYQRGKLARLRMILFFDDKALASCQYPDEELRSAWAKGYAHFNRYW